MNRMTQEGKAKLEELVARVMKDGQARGIAVGIVNAAGEIQYENYFGYRDAENKLPITRDTIFGMASVTKSFTALSIMQMQQDGLLKVDDPVSRYIPEFTNKNQSEPVKLWHLMCHSGGYFPLPRIVVDKTAQEIAALLKTPRPERIVMGFPRNMDGSEGPRADLYREFAALLEELQKAEKFIFLEYFIIDEGYMWGSILKILADKAAQGVDVRVLYDGMLEISTLPWDYPRRLEKLGIRCKAFAPIQPFLSTHYNYRDHRKILVIDGKVAFTGGVNLADEYINRKERFGHWKDTAILLRGEAVQSFTLMFLQMWNLTEKEPRWDEALLPSPPVEAEGYVMPYCDCPLDDYKVGESVYMDILNRAKDYVHIMTPYLILDNEMETALKFAAQRGVDVKLILPGIPDKKIVYILTQANYEILLESGVQIYQYTPGFIHSKSFVCDDEVATVGTINMDYRSMYLHFECGVWMYGSSAVAQVKEDALTTFEQCEQINMDYCRKKKFAVRALRGALKFLAPLL